MSKAHVEEALVVELANLVSGGLADLQERLRLRPTIAALPKNSLGNLGHDEVRLAVRRAFTPRGWLIKGLEPDGPAAWVAPYAQQLLEQRRGQRGLGLADVAALVATLEKLVAKEASERLQVAYRGLGLSPEREVVRDEMEAAVRLFMAGHLGANLSSAPAWPQVEDWLQRMEVPEGGLSFDAMLHLVEEIADKYARLSIRSCREVKTGLLEAEAGRAGRVSLQDFNAQPPYMHWRFDESIEELRALGVLDEADPQAPRVVVADYVAARPSCLGGSSVYSACCRSECEALMADLEHSLAAPEAEPQHIAKAAAELGSNIAKATLPVLSRRLEALAVAHGGVVPLHSEHFADWMHHAFPKVCPRAPAGAAKGLPWAEAEELLTLRPMLASWAMPLALVSALIFACVCLSLASLTPTTEQPTEEQPTEEQPTDEQPTEEQPTEEQLKKEQPAKAEPTKRAKEQPKEKKSAGQQQPAEKPAETAQAQVAEKPSAKAREPTGALAALVALCLLALATDLLDTRVVTGALAAGLVVLAANRLIPKQAPSKIKEC